MADRSPVDTAELRRLLAEATPGPWKAEDGLEVRSADDWQIAEVMGGDDESAPNVHLIVALRNSGTALLDEIDALRAQVNSLKADHDFEYSACEVARKDADALRAKLAESEAACAVLAKHLREHHILWAFHGRAEMTGAPAIRTADVQRVMGPSVAALEALPASVRLHLEEDAALREVAVRLAATDYEDIARELATTPIEQTYDDAETQAVRALGLALAHLDAVRAKGGG